MLIDYKEKETIYSSGIKNHRNSIKILKVHKTKDSDNQEYERRSYSQPPQTQNTGESIPPTPLIGTGNHQFLKS